MPGRASNAYSSTGNPYLRTLSEPKDDLAENVDNVGRDPHVIAVDHPQLKLARIRANGVTDPIISNPLPSPSQVCTLSLEATGSFLRLRTNPRANLWLHESRKLRRKFPIPKI